MIMASRTLEKAMNERPTTAWALFFAPGRWSKGFMGRKHWPAFWPWPAKLKPARQKTPYTAVFSLLRK